MTSPELARAASLIRSIPDVPKPGIVFRDVMPLLADARAFAAVIEAMAAPFAGRFGAVAGLEARGFLFAGAIAQATGTGLVPVRKAGRLPRPAARRDYTIEYGEATIEVQDDLPTGARVLIADDVLATGGTVEAACHVLREVGCRVVGATVLFAIPELRGRERIGDIELATVFEG